MSDLKLRAVTREQKQDTLLRLLAAWCMPGICDMRLGQLIENAHHGYLTPLFNVEDGKLVKEIEEFAGDYDAMGVDEDE